MSTIHRLRPSKRANEAMGEDLSETERSVMIAAAANKLSELFDTLDIDHRNDHNTRDTPHRVARMLLTRLRGRFSNRRFSPN
jgi:GTP cyclohydrolase I